MAAAIRPLCRNVNQQGDIHCSPFSRRPTAALTSLRRKMARSWYRALPKIHPSKVEIWPSIYWILCIGIWRRSRLNLFRGRWQTGATLTTARTVSKCSYNESKRRLPHFKNSLHRVVKREVNIFLESLSQEFNFKATEPNKNYCF